MDIEDFLIEVMAIISCIIIIVLGVLGIYAEIRIIDESDNTNDFQECICEKVEK